MTTRYFIRPLNWTQKVHCGGIVIIGCSEAEATQQQRQGLMEVDFEEWKKWKTV